MERAGILLVDDQPSNIVALEAILSDSGYQLFPAGSGPEALRLLEEHEFAVVLLDVQMPGMDGFETARRIRSSEKSKLTPIVFVTAIYPAETFAAKGYASGAVDYLFKPLNPDILRAKVAVFVELFRKTKKIEEQGRLLRENERREKERQLAELKDRSERRYRRLIESIPQAVVWAADPKTFELRYVSSQAQRVTGWSQSEWLESSFLNRQIDESERASFFEALRQARESGGEAEIEHRFWAKDGSLMWLHTSVRMVQDDQEESAELRGMSFDVSRLKRAIFARDEFLSIASHELKTPLTPLQFQMQGFMRLLRKGKFETAPRENLREMLMLSDSQVTRLGRLIDELLDVSRLSGGQLQLNCEESNLGELVKQVVEQFKFELEEADCSIELMLEPEVRGEWDRLRLEQVIANLLANGAKYGAGRPIRLELLTKDHRAILKIQDQGIGISPQDQGRIFERFERAVSSRHYGGLGLGLFITRHIVELHGGRIAVESEIGKGATFIVTLPLTSPDCL